MNVVEMQKSMLKILSSAQDERDSLNRFVDDPVEGRENPEWVIHERQAMLTAINRKRQLRQLPEIDELALLRWERQASGHVDYSKKFALYCAWLALGIENEMKVL